MDEAKRHEIPQWLVKAEHDLRFSIGKQPHPEGCHHASERFSELVEHPLAGYIWWRHQCLVQTGLVPGASMHQTDLGFRRPFRQRFEDRVLLLICV